MPKLLSLSRKLNIILLERLTDNGHQCPGGQSRIGHGRKPFGNLLGLPLPPVHTPPEHSLLSAPRTSRPLRTALRTAPAPTAADALAVQRRTVPASASPDHVAGASTASTSEARVAAIRYLSVGESQ